MDTEQIIAADQKQIDEGLTELEQELDALIQDEKSIQSSLGRIVQSLRNQLQRAK